MISTKALKTIPKTFMNETNQWLTEAIFVERSQSAERKWEPMFTLKPHDIEHKGRLIPSLQRIYVQMSDTTEYRFANEVLGGWAHWRFLCSKPFFKETLEAMRTELEVKLKADAIFNVLEVATDKDAKGHLEANKFLLKEQYFIEDTKTRGRPSRKEVESNISLEVQDRKRMLEDLERISKVN